MPLLEATEADVLSLSTTLPPVAKKDDLAAQFDAIISGIQAQDSNVVFLPDPAEIRSMRDPDVRAVTEMVARLVHPSNPDRVTNLSRVPIPPGWNNPGQARDESVGTIGTVAVHRSGTYERDGAERQGLAVWHATYFVPGRASQRTVFRPGNIETSTLKLVEFTPDGGMQDSYVIPTAADRLSPYGVLLMREKPLVGAMATGLNRARPLAPAGRRKAG